MLHPTSTARIFVRMEPGPGVLARVLGPFAVAGLAPYALLLRPGACATAFVVADFDPLDDDAAALLVAKVRQMPCVLAARLSLRLGPEPRNVLGAAAAAVGLR